MGRANALSSYYEKFLATGEVKCIDEEIPFEIPNGWEWCRLREVIFSPKYGTSNKSTEKGEMPVLRMGNIQNGEIVFEKLVYSNNAEDNRKYALICGDLLFNRTNSAELVGKTGIYRGQQPAIYAGYIILLRPILINSDYLNYILGSSYARSYCKEVKTIGVQQCNINADKISNFLIPIAPYSEQIRIIQTLHIISVPLLKFSKEQANKESLNFEIHDKLKKSILQEAIRGNLVPQIAEEGTAQELLKQIKQEKQQLVKDDDNKYYEQIDTKCIDISESIPFEVPIGWCWTRLSVISNLYTGNSISETEKATRYTNVQGMEYIGTKDVSFNHVVNYANGIAIPNEHISQFKIAPSRSVLLCIEGGSAGRKIAQIEKSVCFGNKLCCFVPYVMATSKYIYFYLQSPSFFENFKGNIAGIIGGVSVNTLKSLLIPLPPIKEQKRIVAQIEKLFGKLK